MRQLPGNLINGLFPLLPFPRTCCLEWTALSTILDFEPSYFGDQKREKRSKRTKKTAKFMGLVEPPFTHGLLVFFFFLLINLFLAVLGFFVSVRGLSLVAESRGHSSSRCAGLSLSRPLNDHQQKNTNNKSWRGCGEIHTLNFKWLVNW